MRKAALLYALGRVGLFFLVAALVWGLSGVLGQQLNGLPLALVAALVSSLIGYFVFARQRIALANALEDQRTRRVEEAASRRARLDEDASS